MKVVQPNLEWYTKISVHRGLSTRCPFASAHLCPRFYQSLSLLGSAGSTPIKPSEDKLLLDKWRKTDLWPITDEQATSISGPENETKHFWNFCPEVTYERFGLFALSLDRYADEIDIELAHSKLTKGGSGRQDWRWTWASVIPLHYSDCVLYSPLLHKTSLPESKSEIYTVDDVSSFFKTDSDTVETLITTGALVGFKILNDWRVRSEDLFQFMSRQIESQQFEVFKTSVSNPEVWAREITKNPDLTNQIKRTEYSEGTFGAFLKTGITKIEKNKENGVEKEFRDVFICHASEDKENIIEPLLDSLHQANISYWYDRAEIKWGDSLTEKINKGLLISHYVIVCLSKSFMSKGWPRKELNAAFSIETESGEVKILPLLSGNPSERKLILKDIPLLSDKYYLSWDGNPAPIVDALMARLGTK